jgi:hypothetical protein
LNGENKKDIYFTEDDLVIDPNYVKTVSSSEYDTAESISKVSVDKQCEELVLERMTFNGNQISQEIKMNLPSYH